MIASVLALGVVFLLLPRPTGWVALHVHKEDGTVFLADFLASGWVSVADVYSGYLHVFPRLVAGLNATILPPEWFSIGIAVSMATLRALFALLSWPVFAAYTRSWRWGIVCASVFLFVPAGQHEVLGNITNLRWFGVAITALVLLSYYRSPLLAVSAGVTAALATLSDPLALLLAPLAIWGLLTTRGWGRSVPTMYFIGFVLQLMAIDPGQRTLEESASILANPLDGLIQLLVRGVDGGVLGMTLTQGMMFVGGLPLAVVAALVILLSVLGIAAITRTDPASTLAMTLVLVGGVVFTATLYFADMGLLMLDEWWTPANASRYSTLAGLFLVPATLLLAKAVIASGWRWSRPLAATALCVLAVAAIADLRGDPWGTHGPEWPSTVAEARASCGRGGPDPLTVQITPDGVPMSWTVPLTCSWLGR